MNNEEIESSSGGHKDVKRLGSFEVAVLLPLLALFTPYGFEYYVIQMCEHIGTVTTWLFSAPIYSVVFLENGLFLTFLGSWQLQIVWYLILLRLACALIMVLYYRNQLTKMKSLLLLGITFLIEQVLIILPLPTGYVFIPAFTLPIPFFMIICLVLLVLRSPEPQEDSIEENQPFPIKRRIFNIVYVIVILCLLLAPAFWLNWDTGYYIATFSFPLLAFPLGLFWEYFLGHHVYRILFAAQIYRYYEGRTTFLRALAPGAIGISITVLLNIPSILFGLQFLFYRPESVILPIPILVVVGTILMILKPMLERFSIKNSSN